MNKVMDEFYTVEQAIAFLTTSNYVATVQDLNHLVRDKKLKPCIFYKGSIHSTSYDYEPIFGSSSHELSNNLIVTGHHFIDFNGYIKPTNDSMLYKLAMNQHIMRVRDVMIFESIERIDLNSISAADDKHMNYVEEGQYVIDDSSSTTKYRVTQNCNHTFDVHSQSIEISVNDFIFLKSELKELLPKLSTSKRNELERTQSNTTKTQPTELENKKYRKNDFRELVLNELINNPDRSDSEIWVHIISNKSLFDVMPNGTLKLKSNNQPITRDKFDRCLKGIKKIPQDEWMSLFKQ